MGRSVTSRMGLSVGTKGRLSAPPFTFPTRSCTIEDDLAPRRGAVQLSLIAPIRARSCVWSKAPPHTLA